jgi:dolichol-phosphate mannosyltransferase
MSHQTNPALSILVPTLNEADNIDRLVTRLMAVIEKDGLEAEVLIVDGGSTDGTQAQVQKWTSDYPIRLIQSDAKRGLAGDLIAAADVARGEFVVVLDADLSHPPETIPRLVRPLLEGTHDMVIASRYVRCGAMLDWPWTRWLASRAATMLVTPLASVKDPLSGFFAVKRKLLLKLARDTIGFKIALEILTRGADSLRVIEVPTVFQNRASGRSKFRVRQILIFLMQLFALSGGLVRAGLDFRFAVVGLSGIVLDVILFEIFFAAHWNVVLCQIGSFLTATLLSYGLAARRALIAFAKSTDTSLWRLCGRLTTIFLLVLPVRSAVFSLLLETWSWRPQAAIVCVALLSASLVFAGSVLFVFIELDLSAVVRSRWRMITVVIVAYVLLLKIAFMGLVNVIPEEAYYWNYAQHLDIGYLDHPPLVAWLIWLSTSLLGSSEFSVRLPAFLAWIVAAIFMFRLTANLCDRSAAFRSVLLLAVLPMYFGMGFFITPDAPLYAAWAGCLYFLERALVAGQRRSWWGVGLCVGLGMLAKYTIALLGLGTLTFLLVDTRSRRWLLRPQPYLAAVMGMVLFSPVLLWNMRNAWASFVFQGPNRWSGGSDFSLHIILASLFLVLTPVGMLAVGKIFLPHRSTAPQSPYQVNRQRRQRLWLLSFMLVPLFVFIVHSLHNDSKLHWTGPVFLAAIPFLAAGMVPYVGEIPGFLGRLVRRAWMPTIVTVLFIYGGVFYYFSLGLPGAPMSAKRAFGPWRLLTQRVDQIEHGLFDETGSEPIIVGMDKHMISSETSFYDSNDRDGVKNTGGPHLFGGRSLMWEFWLPRSAAVGKNILMVDFDPKRLGDPSLAQHFERIGEVVNETLKKDGRVVGSFYWRIGYGYRRK